MGFGGGDSRVIVEEIARVLGGRRVGSRWMARCPAHEDRSPSLSIGERDSRVLVHCFAGCEQEVVLASLRARGLWPEREFTWAERLAWRERYGHAEAVAELADAWAHCRRLELEREKTAALEAGDFDAIAAPSASLCALSRGPAAVLALYHDARLCDPDATARTVEEGLRDLEDAERIAARIVGFIAKAQGVYP